MNFNLEELRSVLEEMGYKDVPRDQLKDFAKDLKRLIRHEERLLRKNQMTENTSPESLREKLDKSPISVDTVCTESSVSKEEDSIKGVPDKELPDAPKSHTHQVDTWKRLKSDPVRLYHWYKTYWDVHKLK